jgi:hypothetical protein
LKFSFAWFAIDASVSFDINPVLKKWRPCFPIWMAESAHRLVAAGHVAPQA